MTINENDIARDKAGKKAAFMGIFGNVVLTIFNFVVGVLSGSSAFIAEAAHTLSDIITSIIALIGFKLGQKPADKEHPYGHGRAESLSGLIIMLFLAFVAFEIVTGAVENIIFIIMHPGAVKSLSHVELTVAMAIIGIVFNFFISRYQIRVGTRIRSTAIVADGKHQQVDILSCVAILIGVVAAEFNLMIVDSIVALFIGIVIIKAAYNIGRDNVNSIMGKIPDDDFLDDINQSAKLVDGVYGVHDVKLNYLGSYVTISLHAEVDPELSFRKAHELGHAVESQLQSDFDIIKMISVQVCPYDENQ